MPSPAGIIQDTGSWRDRAMRPIAGMDIVPARFAAMYLTLSALLVLAQDTSLVFSGRNRQLMVAIPRVDTTIAIDGDLSEPVWRRASRLTDFSQYQPVDGRPAAEPTEVLVWYASDAIYFGIRARGGSGSPIRATQANRDNIAAEDHVQILLDTYNDQQIAFVFGVNALGVQQDGTRSDNFSGGAGGRSGVGGGFGNINPLDGNVDLNPDFAFESKGRLVEGGYDVEVRIPFKSLRYGEGTTQDWGINILRRIQHSGFQDSWAPVMRGNSRFLSQSGRLVGLHDLKRGLVLEMTPTATDRLDGLPDAQGGRQYNQKADFGADVRWGISQNLTLNGTVNPDFSQVEADVGQVTLNERFALFYPEKRPFFLDGLELFDTPGQLIYTRRIGNPDAGLKLAGKIGKVNVAALTALDGQDQSLSGNRTPIFGATRLRTDLSKSSTLGAVVTTREVGPDHSRLIGADFRTYFSKVYYVELQAAESWTAEGSRSGSGPLLRATWDRTGRGWGFNYSFKAIGPDFAAAAGFVNRPGVIEVDAFNRVSAYGKPGALVQTAGAFFGASRLWDYRSPGDGTIEGSEFIFPSATVRGGWQLSGSLSRTFFNYDPGFYQGLGVLTAAGDTVGFVVPGREDNQVSGSFTITSPTFQHFTVSATVGGGDTPIFREAAPGRNRSINATIDLRPTTALRAAFQLTRLSIDRQRDGSRFSSETIPRLKVEYQVNRSIFLRFVGQYSVRKRSAAVDRAGRPILVGRVQDLGTDSNELQMDWLFSYRPSPGTLLYLGYGSTYSELDPRRSTGLRRGPDGLFGKVSYLFRL